MDLNKITERALGLAIKEVIDDTIEDLMYQREQVINEVIRNHAEKILKSDEMQEALKERLSDLIKGR